MRVFRGGHELPESEDRLQLKDLGFQTTSNIMVCYKSTEEKKRIVLFGKDGNFTDDARTAYTSIFNMFSIDSHMNKEQYTNLLNSFSRLILIRYYFYREVVRCNKLHESKRPK
jgi:hypothetical protein